MMRFFCWLGVDLGSKCGGWLGRIYPKQIKHILVKGCTYSNYRTLKDVVPRSLTTCSELRL